MTKKIPKELVDVIDDNGYVYPKVFADGEVAAILPMMFTYAIIYGINRDGYEDRWCYHTAADAKGALEAWDGAGEPAGWHRYPKTGRRREDGREWINL